MRSRREFQVGPSEAIHSDPRALDPLGQLADVDLILLGRVSLLRILLSVISVLSVVIRSSYLPESSPRLSGPARPCGRGKLAQFSLLQRFAVWWVAPPWPILSVAAVLLALCRLVESKVATLETRLGARQRRRPPTVHRGRTHAPRLQRPVASEDEASACSELRLGCHPETPVIEPCQNHGMVQILGYSGNSTDRPHASTVGIRSVVGPIAGSGTLEAVPAQPVEPVRVRLASQV